MNPFRGLALLALVLAALAAAPAVARADHWQYGNGYWNFWHDGDQRWYYTDGRNWYYSQDNRWQLYRFDAKFGRDNFRRGDHRLPAEGQHPVPSHAPPRHDRRP